MALTGIQRDVLNIVGERRRASGEAYVAGGVALNEVLGAARRSHDIDLFHDTDTALAASWDADRRALIARGFAVDVARERTTFVEAVVSKAGASVVLEWVRDSAFRFFPLVEHPTLGLTLHPVDLATNKVLALVGRVEARDFVDVMTCHERLQPFGLLAWAAAGKDPGFGPRAIVEEAVRATRYRQADFDALDFDGAPPDATRLALEWRAAVASARTLIDLLPSEKAGTCVLTPALELARHEGDALRDALRQGQLVFHEGRIRGAFPALRADVVVS